MKIPTLGGKYGLFGKSQQREVLPCKSPRRQPDDTGVRAKKKLKQASWLSVRLVLDSLVRSFTETKRPWVKAEALHSSTPYMDAGGVCAIQLNVRIIKKRNKKWETIVSWLCK